MRKGCLFGIAGLVVVGLVVLAGFSWIMGIQRDMVRLQQGVLAQEGRYGAALETLSEKIKGIWAIEKDFLEHEKDTLTDVIRARAEALDRAGQGRSSQRPRPRVTRRRPSTLPRSSGRLHRGSRSRSTSTLCARHTRSCSPRP
ncbi:MAG: hypothetical protein QME92_01095 [Bacillota bacterium]|nr:hypothetical protein [Bacillota bacterium]